MPGRGGELGMGILGVIHTGMMVAVAAITLGLGSDAAFGGLDPSCQSDQSPFSTSVSIFAPQMDGHLAVLIIPRIFEDSAARSVYGCNLFLGSGVRRGARNGGG